APAELFRPAFRHADRNGRLRVQGARQRRRALGDAGVLAERRAAAEDRAHHRFGRRGLGAVRRETVRHRRQSRLHVVGCEPARGRLHRRRDRRTQRHALDARSFLVKLTVTDAVGLTDSADVTLTFAPKLSITTRELRAAKVGHLFRARLATTGGVDPRAWAIVHGKLPARLTFPPRTPPLPPPT